MGSDSALSVSYDPAFLAAAPCSQVRFVVMANIFVTDLQIHRRYDIKGSTDGRTVGLEGRAK
jgi:hypothetical protein